MKPFELGDKVKCVNANCSPLTMGETYTVENLIYDDLTECYFVTLKGVHGQFSTLRFKKTVVGSFKKEVVEIGGEPYDVFTSTTDYPIIHFSVGGGKNTVPSEGGPSKYYDFQEGWVTLNDVLDFKAKNQWKEFSFHLGNIFKACFRWGNKEGTTQAYDARKIVYSGLRILMMMQGVNETRGYLKELLNDPQFKENRDD